VLTSRKHSDWMLRSCRPSWGTSRREASLRFPAVPDPTAQVLFRDPISLSRGDKMSAFSATDRTLIFVIRFYITVTSRGIPAAAAGVLLLRATVILSWGADAAAESGQGKHCPRDAGILRVRSGARKTR
jgi:hypothetical protein